MEASALDFITHNIGANGIWFALFIYLFYTGKKESQAREQQLVSELQKSQDLLQSFAGKYDLIIEKLDKLEMSMGQKGGGGQ